MPRRIALLSVVMAVACACSSTEPRDQWTGTWELTRVDNQALPATVTVGSSTVTVTGGLLLLNEGGKGIFERDCEPRYEQAFVRWSVAGNVITVSLDESNPVGPVPVTQTFVKHSGDILEQSRDGHVWRYQRD